MKWVLLLAVFASVITLVIISKKRYFNYFYNAYAFGGAGAGGAASSAKILDAVKPGTAGSASWTFPLVLFTSILIAWGAEVGQFLVSQGMTLAVLAWLQVMPEFAVEAAISHEAALDPEKLHLVTANFTGSNRLLVGLGWPLIYFTALYGNHKRKRAEADRMVKDLKARLKKEKKRGKGASDPFIRQLNKEIERHEGPVDKKYEITLEQMHSVEVMGLLVPTIYFFVIWMKGTLTLWDTLVLVVMYIAYLYILNLMPPEDASKAKEMHGVAKKVLTKSKTFQKIFVLASFIAGGVILFFIAEPFLHSLLQLAIFIGIPTYWFIQWIAPFMSEFPEKLSAFYWARTVIHAPMAMMNMVSSKINQWTILIAMIPMVYCITLGRVEAINFDDSQRWEILLTIAQSLLAVVILFKMRINLYDASMLFGLWFIQFVVPDARHIITFVYFILAAMLFIYHFREIRCFSDFEKTMRESAAQRRKTLATVEEKEKTKKRKEWKEEEVKDPEPEERTRLGQKEEKKDGDEEDDEEEDEEEEDDEEDDDDQKKIDPFMVD